MNEPNYKLPETTGNTGETAHVDGTWRVSALDLALDLLDCIPRIECNSVKWERVAARLAPHCKGREDTTEAALRIVAAELAETRRLLCSNPRFLPLFPASKGNHAKRDCEPYV